MAKKRKQNKPAARRPTPLLATDAAIERQLDRIDETLLHRGAPPTFDMIEQLADAERRLPEVLAKRLISGRALVPVVAFELLATFGGSRAKTLLRRIADEPRTQDIVRFGARRRAGWPQRGEAKRRRAFLESLKDPDGTLVEAVRQATDSWPPSGEILEEVLGYLSALPSERRRDLVERIAGELGPQTIWLLHALLHLDDPPTQRLALSELVRFRDPTATGPISRLAGTARHADLRTEAVAALQRLGLRAVGGPGPARPLEFPPVERALFTVLDNEGGQAILVARRLVEGASLFVNIFHDTHSGLKTVAGASQMMTDLVDEMVDGFEEEGIDVLEVDLTAVRGAVAAALEVNVANGRAIPPAFELWEPLLHDAFPPPPNEPLVRPELDDATYADRPDLVKASGKLVDHPFFESWTFGGTETSLAMLTAPPPTSRRWSERQYRALIDELVDPATRDRFRRILRRQAWLLEQDEDLEMRDVALATAAHLAEAGPAELAKLPFLRRLVQRSVGDVVHSLLYPPYQPADHS